MKATCWFCFIEKGNKIVILMMMMMMSMKALKRKRMRMRMMSKRKRKRKRRLAHLCTLRNSNGLISCVCFDGGQHAGSVSFCWFSSQKIWVAF